MIEEKGLSIDEVKQFVVAGHFDLEKVKRMLSSNPRLLNTPYQWSETDSETAVQAAAHVGNRVNAEFLLGKGAPLEICTAAMLGLDEEVRRSIKSDPARAKANGAHGIPLLAHAVFSENMELIQFVFKNGAITGANLALHNAVLKGNLTIVQWLLDNAGAYVNSKNYQGKTPLRVAKEPRNEPIQGYRTNPSLAKLLAERGGTE